jgi:hypothetical protein
MSLSRWWMARLILTGLSFRFITELLLGIHLGFITTSILVKI